MTRCKIIGDADWTRKVRRIVNQNVPRQEVEKDVYVIQLDRRKHRSRSYSSATAIAEAAKISSEPNRIVVLVGSCPVQDYQINNPQIWEKFPKDRVFFFDASRGAAEFPSFLGKILRP